MDAAVNLSLHPRQAEAFHTTATEVLFGGSAGPGKSHCMRVSAIVWASEIPGLQVYLFRRLYEDLIKNHMEGPKGFRSLLAPWVESGFCRIVDNEIRFWNGSKIYLCHCQHEKDRFKYQGAEIHVLLVDELTHFTETIYRFLRGRVRMVGIAVPEKYAGCFPRVLCGSNPGNIGHAWVKNAFIDNVQDGNIRHMPPGEGGMRRQFIRARLVDNPSLLEDDPNYEAKLSGLGNAALVKAMKDGDWGVIEGAFFTEWSDDRHVIRPVELPKWWNRFRSGDWGSAKPYAFHWMAIASDDWQHPDGILVPRGALIVYRELYGIKTRPEGGYEADTGVKEPSDVVARRILALEGAEFDSSGRMVKKPTEDITYAVLDPAAFATISGPSIAETMRREGCAFREADNKRVAASGAIGGHDQFRKRLVGDAEGRAMIYFFANCIHAIRTIPVLQHDSHRPEDIDTHMEDHCFAAGTFVETDQGPKPIEALIGTEGRVLSVGGWQDYTSCRLTRRAAKLIALRFHDGVEVTCTPDHRFMTKNGWVMAKDMVGFSCIRLSSPTQYRNSMARGITSAANIFNSRVQDFISQCGDTIMGQSQKVCMFTTKTGTRATTEKTIWSFLLQTSTWLDATKIPWWPTVGTQSNLQGMAPAHGMVLKRAWLGIVSIMKMFPTRCTRATTLSAHIATLDLVQQVIPSFAPMPAGQRHDALLAQTMSKGAAMFAGHRSLPISTKGYEHVPDLAVRSPLRRQDAVCLSLREAGEGDVYCLTVPETGCFAVNGGLVVSNCYDSVRYGCMSRPYLNTKAPATPEEARQQEIIKAQQERIKARQMNKRKSA